MSKNKPDKIFDWLMDNVMPWIAIPSIIILMLGAVVGMIWLVYEAFIVVMS